jgi:hypothetical protein
MNYGVKDALSRRRRNRSVTSGRKRPKPRRLGLKSRCTKPISAAIRTEGELFQRGAIDLALEQFPTDR